MMRAMPPHLPFTFEPVRTERLLLRMMVADDVDAIHAYQSRDDVCRYLLFEPRDRAAVAEKVAQHAQATTLAGDGDYWQIAVEHDGHVIGDVFFTIKSVEHSTGEIGWTMHPDFHGHGYMTEAAGAGLRIAFETLGLHRVIADPRPAQRGLDRALPPARHARGGLPRGRHVGQRPVGRHRHLRAARA